MSRQKSTARELEFKAAAAAPPKIQKPLPPGEAFAMLARRGLQPQSAPRAAPLSSPFGEQAAECLSALLGHYAFRLFLRGAIQKRGGFLPEETTRYLSADKARAYAEALVVPDLAERVAGGRYRLRWPVRTFGDTLEWYVARELRLRFGFDVAFGVKLHVRGVGGDLDVVAAAEGKLIYLELKSSPPKNLTAAEVRAFLERVRVLRPDVTLFVVDTALRLGDKILPMLVEQYSIRIGRVPLKPRHIAPGTWALTPHLYIVNGRRDLMANIGKAIAAGLLALSPLF